MNSKKSALRILLGYDPIAFPVYYIRLLTQWIFIHPMRNESKVIWFLSLDEKMTELRTEWAIQFTPNTDIERVSKGQITIKPIETVAMFISTLQLMRKLEILKEKYFRIRTWHGLIIWTLIVAELDGFINQRNIRNIKQSEWKRLTNKALKETLFKRDLKDLRKI